MHLQFLGECFTSSVQFQVFPFSPYRVTAMALIESAASFRQRCDEILADGTLGNRLVAAGVDTFSKLAFSVGTPQTPPTEVQFDAFSIHIFGAGANVGQTASLKRLHFEATTLVIASLKERITGDGSEVTSVRKVATAEKRARLEAQAVRLQGLRIEGELSPSHQLIDIANHILETGPIIWVAPSRCTKRDDEVHLAIREKTTSIQIENAQLKVAPSNELQKADTGSELKLQWCFQRRGVAFDQCRLLSWATHDKWVSVLLNCLSSGTPVGYSTVKTEQLIRADREIWTILAREYAGTLRMNAAGVIPLDARFDALITDPRVTMMLLPLPGGSRKDDPPRRNDVKVDDVDPPKKVKKVKKTRAERQCPEELKKFDLSSDHGRICWNYNMKSGCSNKTSGNPAKCNRGSHLCANCKKPGHSVVVCRALQQA